MSNPTPQASEAHDPESVIHSVIRAWNAHDLEAYLAHFADDYDSRWPIYPERDFVGVENVRDRWSHNFARMPDFRAELLGLATNDAGEVWTEYRWLGTLSDGSRFDQQGIVVNVIRDGRIAAARIYLYSIPEGEGR